MENKTLKSMSEQQINNQPSTSSSPSFIDQFVEKLPSLHLKGYSYCGPNTDLENLLAHGEHGKNELDHACKEHDIAYAESKDHVWRYVADKMLVLKAFRRMYANDSRIGERSAALLVSVIIGIKIILSKIESCIRFSFRKCLAMKSNKTQCEDEC